MKTNGGQESRDPFLFYKRIYEHLVFSLVELGEVEIGKESGVTCCTKSTLQQHFVRHCAFVRKEQAIRS